MKILINVLDGVVFTAEFDREQLIKSQYDCDDITDDEIIELIASTIEDGYADWSVV